jgi:hypothetical protein
MNSPALIVGIISALIVGAALGMMMDNYPAGMISGAAIGVVVIIALNTESWGRWGGRNR